MRFLLCHKFTIIGGEVNESETSPPKEVDFKSWTVVTLHMDWKSRLVWSEKFHRRLSILPEILPAAKETERRDIAQLGFKLFLTPKNVL